MNNLRSKLSNLKNACHIFRHYLRWPYPMYKPSQFDSFNHEHTCLASKLTNIELSDICPLAIRLCNRPFATIEEMDETLIRNWNAKVTNGDTVYILGDLLFRNEKPAEEYLKQLKGKKHLIIGNHDRDWVKKCNLKDFFESVNNLHFISDGKRQMTLCHYPMMSWPHMTRCYMVFGHIHGNTDADYWPLIRENDLMLNAGADVNGFAPVTFEEMQENNYRHKAGWNPELCTMEADQ